MPPQKPLLVLPGTAQDYMARWDAAPDDVPSKKKVFGLLLLDYIEVRRKLQLKEEGL
jgi:hypothetical protein